MNDGMEIIFWGTRGSMAAPYPDRMRYGGNTSCVSARWSGGLAVFDGGTGIRQLGMKLMREEKEDRGLNIKELHIFISHLHLDHVSGLPFFPLLFMKDWKIHFYGEARTEYGFREDLNRSSKPPYWPISFEQAAAEVVWHEIQPGQCMELPGGARMYAMAADHPNGSVMYRLEADGGSVVYGLDCELTDRVRGPYEEFVRGCDLLVFDGMYTENEYPMVRGFGHSTWLQGVKMSKVCNVGTLCISHHDWGRTDDELDEMEIEMKKLEPRAVFAREGMVFQLGKKE